MKTNIKLIRLAVIPAIVWSLTGCGGFSGSQSISPASFLLPGILKANPQPLDPNNPTLPTTPVLQAVQAE